MSPRFNEHTQAKRRAARKARDQAQIDYSHGVGKGQAPLPAGTPLKLHHARKNMEIAANFAVRHARQGHCARAVESLVEAGIYAGQARGILDADFSSYGRARSAIKMKQEDVLEPAREKVARSCGIRGK